jgi:hypothetical protein
MRTALAAILLVLVTSNTSCSTAELAPAPAGNTPTPTPATPTDDGGLDSSVPEAGTVVPRDGGLGNLRIMAANISSGPSLSYGPADGVRIFQGLAPDIVLIQEFNSGTSTAAELDTFVTTTFGAAFTYYREPGVELPNGIISRYPIMESGRWADPKVTNRGFAYAKIAVPGAHPLWAVSLHLLTSGAAARASEATALVAQIRTVVPEAVYLVVGGDLNTSSRSEASVTTLSEVVVTVSPFPADGSGNENTNAPRSAAYDWLLADVDLTSLHVPVTIGQKSFAAGLVFDSRVYVPLADVTPVQATDSAAQNMQHMPVVRDFRLPD